MTVEELKADILKPRGRLGYVIPTGFYNEPLSTDLHIAIRELLAEGRIVADADCLAGYEKLMPAPEQENGK